MILPKPLTFRQEITLEQYLTVLQEFILNPSDQVKEVLTELSEEVSKFLTVEELEEIESREIASKESLEPTQQTLELSILLPYGWNPDDYEASPPTCQLDMNNRIIYLSTVIQRKPPEDELLDF